MNLIIENDKLKVGVSTLGAELQFITGKNDGFEYLWQGNPEFWKGRATNVFPNCGRLWEGKYTFNKNTYELPCHGFAKLFQFEPVLLTPTKVSLMLASNEETKKVYPFSFNLTIIYSLNNNKLSCQFKVENCDSIVLPFALGGHPGFNLPLQFGLTFSDHYVEFENECSPKKLVLSPTCFYTGKNKRFPLKNNKILPLSHDLFDNDAIFLTDTDKTLTLKSDKTQKNLKISFSEMKYIGFWHNPKTEAPFVCIEPWTGVPGLDGVIEDFSTKGEFIRLPAGENYINGFDIEINE